MTISWGMMGPMRLLILGGTWFLGRAVAEAALDNGWTVTAFNRGKSGPGLPGAETVHGDRERPDDLRRLARSGPWDAVIDTMAFVPRHTLAAAAALVDTVQHYVLISSVNAYTGWPDIPLTEDSSLFECPTDADDTYAADRGEAAQYGTLKAGCEKAVQQVFGPSRTTVLRPGVILGPHEYVGRLSWWLLRASHGGEILAPGPADQPIQPVDVRDAAAFALRCASQQIGGDFNITAPIGHATFADLLDTCVEVTLAGARPVWVDPGWLSQHGVSQWTELPLWRTRPGVWRVDNTRAEKAGLRCRPLPETVADTWGWMTGGGTAVKEERGEAARAAEHGLSTAREADLLRLWQEQQ